jgi:hypothetical protein
MDVSGQGSVKVELRSASNGLLAQWREPVSGAATLSGQIPAGIGPVKLFNVVVDSPSDIRISGISLGVRVPKLNPLCTAFLFSYAQLLRAYDPVAGRVKDHAQFPIGDSDSVPGDGFVALAAAAAADLSVVSRPNAAAIARHAIDALLATPREPNSGWLPHWLKNGQRRPKSEYSTVDTALAVISALEAASMLGLGDEQARLRQLVDSLSFPAVTVAGKISHGLDGNGQVLRPFWDDWGGETALVELLRAYQNPRLPDIVAVHHPPAFCGRGFIYELGALFARDYGAPGAPTDKWGVNWYTQRRREYAAQRARTSTVRPCSASRRPR